jgi:hypothetical protein
MYRVYILLFLAIASSVFAVDSSQSILQAKKIADTSVTISWSPMSEATKYKIFYDESALLEPTNPRLLLDTDFITTTEGELTQISPATDYTIKVHGYNTEWKEIGTTIPLHVRTYSAIPQMNLARDPLVSSETTLELWFSRPIDSSKTQITLTDVASKKPFPVLDIKNSPNDLRIIIITLKTKMELDGQYELTLQKVTSLDGAELPPENRIPIKVVYGGVLPPLDTLSPDVVPSPDPLQDELPPVLSEPVPIDTLPQTGPEWIIVFLLLASVLFFAQKKLSKRA